MSKAIRKILPNGSFANSVAPKEEPLSPPDDSLENFAPKISTQICPMKTNIENIKKKLRKNFIGKKEKNLQRIIGAQTLEPKPVPQSRLFERLGYT